MGPRVAGSLFSSTSPLPAFSRKLCDCSFLCRTVRRYSLLSSFLSFHFFFNSPRAWPVIHKCTHKWSPNPTRDLAVEKLLMLPELVTRPPLPLVLSGHFQAPSLNRAPGGPGPDHALAGLPAAQRMLNNEETLMAGRRLKRSSPPHSASGKQGAGRELLHMHQMESRARQTAGSQ